METRLPYPIILAKNNNNKKIVMIMTITKKLKGMLDWKRLWDSLRGFVNNSEIFDMRWDEFINCGWIKK